MTLKSKETRYWGRRFRIVWAFWGEGMRGRREETSRRLALAPMATGAAVEPAAQV